MPVQSASSTTAERTPKSRAFGSLIALCLVFAWLAPAPAPAEQIEIRLNRVESFIPHFSIKREMNAAYRPVLSQILADAHKRMGNGEGLNCSAQIFDEVHWLVNYTDRRADIEARIEDLKASLEQTDQSFAAQQDPRDGSFAPCIDDWLWRFFRSVDPLKELAKRGEKPAVPLKIWEPVDTPEELTAYMRSLLVSELDSGHNKRKELNLAVTALGQLLWLDYTAAVFPEHLDRDALAEALRAFVDEEWQDPETGYWGAWFDDGETVRKTQDLSMTFHIISYRGGDVRHLDEIGRTTMAIRNVKYPFGWDTGGTQNNHHAYDIARIVNLTWSELDTSSRAQASANLFILMSRSLSMSIDSKGAFDPSPYTTVGEGYYFGISFFEEMGLFGNPVQREPLFRMTNTERLYDQVSTNLAKLDQSDPWVAAARRKLMEMDR
ncbi:MAG: hypothetical protein AAFP17_16900 [Pseudomonadota bacterium]